jgi:hypothetical protein
MMGLLLNLVQMLVVAAAVSQGRDGKPEKRGKGMLKTINN